MSVTNKGTPCIILNNSKFSEQRETKEGVSWRCTHRGCSVTLLTDVAREKLLSVGTRAHIHPSLRENSIQTGILRVACKRKATEIIAEIKPAKLIWQELRAIENTASIEHSDIAVHRNRRKTMPVLPKSAEETCQQLTNMSIINKSK